MADSSTFNKPPHTQQDYWVVNAFLLNAGLTSDSPDNGVHVLPERPSGYHHETRGPGIVIGNSACIAVMIIVTVTRLYLRWFSPRLNWGADDALMIPAVLMAIAYPALQISMVVYGGAGQHIYDITYHEYYIYHWLAAAAQIDFFVCVGLVKMSIAVFNMRLTGMATTRLWNIGNRPFFGIVLAYIIIAFFLNVFQCVPAITSFDYVAIGKSGVPPKCLGVQKMNTILRVINITMDYCLLTVPIIIVGSLQMSMKKKMRLAGIFAVGALACIGSVMTLVAKSKLKTDALWNYTSLLGWTLVELVFGVIAASLPTLAFLLPGGMRSNADYSVTAISRANATFSAQRQNTFQDRSNVFKQHLAPDDEGIMRHDELELSSMAASEVDLEGLVVAPWSAERKDVTTIYSRPLPRSDGKQPGQYGPLESDGQ